MLSCETSFLGEDCVQHQEATVDRRAHHQIGLAIHNNQGCAEIRWPLVFEVQISQQLLLPMDFLEVIQTWRAYVQHYLHMPVATRALAVRDSDPLVVQMGVVLAQGG